MKKRMSKPIVILFFALLAVSALNAQITYETTMTSNGFMGMGAFTSTDRTMISGDARRQESNMQFTGSVMKHLSPKGTAVEITRLDKEVFWKFTDREKKYTEISFAEYKRLFEEGKLSPAMPTQPSQEEKGESEYEWQEPVVSVKRLGDAQQINSFSCERYLVTVTTIGKHKPTGKLDTLLFSADMYNSRDAGNAMKQVSDFELRLVKALGLDKLDHQALAQVAAQYGDQIKKLTAEMSKLEGYPIRTTMVFTITTHATAKPPAEQVEAQEPEEEPQTDVRDVKGKLGGMFGKKIKDMAKAKAKPKDKAQSGSAAKELFQSTLEVKSISSGEVPAAQFEVPADYKLQKKDK